jgi:predicted nucleic acid-binding protein
MRQAQAVFVDSGAWIALALARDPLHARAREQWELLQGAGARLHTSVPIVIETITFLNRNASRDVALAWKESIYAPGVVKILACELRDLKHAWDYFRRADLHRLSARCDKFCDHEASAHSDGLQFRSPLCCSRIQVGDITGRHALKRLLPRELTRGSPQFLNAGIGAILPPLGTNSCASRLRLMAAVDVIRLRAHPGSARPTLV